MALSPTHYSTGAAIVTITGGVALSNSAKTKQYKAIEAEARKFTQHMRKKYGVNVECLVDGRTVEIVELNDRPYVDHQSDRGIGGWVIGIILLVVFIVIVGRFFLKSKTVKKDKVGWRDIKDDYDDHYYGGS